LQVSPEIYSNDWNADFFGSAGFGSAGIGRGFIINDIAPGEHFACLTAGVMQGLQVRPLVLVDRRWYCDDVNIAVSQGADILGQIELL
jgi:hypothetical protein